MQQNRYSSAIARSVPQAEFLAAASRVFSIHGYSGTTIERIAEAAGVSRVTLHRRGVTKDGLLAELVGEATDDYQRRLWQALTVAGSAAERLIQALDSLCAASEEHMGLLIALRSQADEVFHENGSEALTRNVFTEPFERLLRDGAIDGSLRVTDPEETATVLFNLVGWTYIHLRTGHRWPPERARRGVIEPLLHGLLADRPPPANSGGSEH
jgi:AcrR family transcriptional regulator